MLAKDLLRGLLDVLAANGEQYATLFYQLDRLLKSGKSDAYAADLPDLDAVDSDIPQYPAPERVIQIQNHAFNGDAAPLQNNVGHHLYEGRQEERRECLLRLAPKPLV